MHNDFKCLNLTLQKVGKILNFEVSLHFIIMISRGRRVLSFLRLLNFPTFLQKDLTLKKRKRLYTINAIFTVSYSFFVIEPFFNFPFHWYHCFLLGSCWCNYITECTRVEMRYLRTIIYCFAIANYTETMNMSRLMSRTVASGRWNSRRRS